VLTWRPGLRVAVESATTPTSRRRTLAAMMRREWSRIRAMISERKSKAALNISCIPIMPSNLSRDKGVSGGNPTLRLLVGGEITFVHL
jgi:hypothetical protein